LLLPAVRRRRMLPAGTLIAASGSLSIWRTAILAQPRSIWIAALADVI